MLSGYPNLCIEFQTQDFLKGAPLDQMNYAVAGVNNGIMTPNEAREYLGKQNMDGADELKDTSKQARPISGTSPQDTGGGGNRLRRPDVHRLAAKLAQLGVDFLFPFLQLVDQALGPRSVKPDAPAGHLEQDGEGLGLQIEDGFHLFAPHQALEVLPELERQRSVLLGVVAHVHGRELPELFLGVHAEVPGGLFEALLGLDLLQVVKAKAVQAVGEAVLVQQRRGDHGVHDLAVDLEAGGREPAQIVGGVVHHLVGGQKHDIFDPPLHAGLVKVAPTLVGNGIVPFPAVHGDGVADDEAVVARPARAEGFHVRITGLQVDRNLLGCG